MPTEQELHDLRVRGMDCEYGKDRYMPYHCTHNFAGQDSLIWERGRNDAGDWLMCIEHFDHGLETQSIARAICYALNERYRLMHEPSPTRDWTPPLGVRHAEEVEAQREDERLAREEAEGE